MIEGIFYFLVALAILLFMITIHELGHYTVGKLLGFKINEFAIGMGPALFKRKNKKTGEVFSIRAIPLGGYCAFEDENGNEKQVEKDGEKQEDKQGDKKGESVATKDKSFVSHAPWKRLIVFVAGAGFNFLSAILIVIIAFSFFGTNMPSIGGIVPGVVEGEPELDEVVQSAAYLAKIEADKTGDYSHCLLEGDIILEINGKKIYLQTDLAKALALSGNDDTEILVLREGEKVKLTDIARKTYVAPEYEDNEFVGWQSAKGLGVYLSSDHVSFTFGEALARSVPFCFSTATAILEAFGQLVTGTLGLRENLGGPITTIDFTMGVVQSGFKNILYLITMISINLAVFNLLPIPALDGSKIIFTTIEWIRGKPINRTVENYIHVIGLLLLFGFVIILDIVKILS